MMKILRLSSANIRKHKTESVLLSILVMLCVLFLGSSVSGARNIQGMFPELEKRTNAWNAKFCTMEDDMRGREKEILQIFENDERVTDCGAYRYLFSFATRLADKDGKESLYVATFIDEENERRIENYAPESALPQELITAMAHPVFLPKSEQVMRGLKEGDPLTLIYGSKKFVFTIAGFYECCFWDSPKLVVTDADYAVLKPLFTRYYEIGYNTAENSGDMQLEVMKDCVEQYSEQFDPNFERFNTTTVYDAQESFNTETNYIILIMRIMAGIIIIAVTVMIWFRIVSDIKEQIVQIGVLEALGYSSQQIALSYVFEYLLIALVGCVLGVLGSFGLVPLLIRIAENMKGCEASHAVAVLPLLASAGAVLLLIFVTAYWKALSVRRYPPVVAFRRGIAAHSFKRSHFPLEKTRHNVHLRLALKGFADRARQNIGLTFVMSITTAAVVLSLILYSFLGKDLNVMFSIAGQELSDMKMEVVQTVDTDEFIEELNAMPEVRKVLATNQISSDYVTVAGSGKGLILVIFRDFAETENIKPFSGRFPQHENEIMITKSGSAMLQKEIGDTLRLRYNHVEQDYIITGIVTAVLNADSVYMTEEGMLLLDPLYRPTSFEVYKAEGVSSEALRDAIDLKFGKSAEDIGGGDAAQSGSTEERIRSAADQKIAALMEQYGITHLEYAIQYGDKTVTGNSDAVKVRSFMNLPEMTRDVLSTFCTAIAVSTRVFMLITAAVVMMILIILMESEIRKQRRELGIMKAMGYTAKELMLQLTFRIMPAAFLSVVIGTLLSVSASKLLISFIGEVVINLSEVLLLDAVILVFCFACAYFGARKIKKISVCELMTE